MLSRATIDRIGERLRDDPNDIASLAELTLFREQVRVSTEGALDIVRAHTTSTVNPRYGKSIPSITEKLRRQATLKLSQMQDIEGCRVVVDSMLEQDALASRLKAAFEKATIHDRRSAPTHGYRALHLVARILDERYEIQIRTSLQHIWAEVAERLAGRYGQELKYGGGDSTLRELLSSYSADVARVEKEESIIFTASTGRELTDVEIDVLVCGYDLNERATMAQVIADGYDEPSLQLQFYRWILDKKRMLREGLMRIFQAE
jgi:ppGpp synthetase/RelA/SpoT-type nucleotidyltranferase